MKIKSIFLQGMWSFDSDERAPIELSDKTVIIGKNNSGKSNILKGIDWFKTYIPQIKGGRGQQIPQPGPADPYRTADGGQTDSSSLRIKVAFSNSEVDKFLRLASIKDEKKRFDVKELLTEAVYFAYDPHWPPPEWEKQRLLLGKPAKPIIEQLITHNIEKGIAEKLRSAIIENAPGKILFVGGWRSVSENDNKITKDLRTMLSPPPENFTLKALEKRLTRFFRGLTGLQDAMLHVEPRHDNISIDVGRHFLPLENFGDGIHQLLVLAYQFGKYKDCVFLIEEPETHIHPGLQRHLFRYLGTLKSDNQYIITTHSPVLLDCIKDASILRTEYDGKSTKVSPCVATNDIYKVLDQLDVRASDILQANLVIWIEGPTDRMFIKRCLELRKTKFTEGLDYSFVYYGGRLMSHITLDENEKELINLLRLSRNAVVVCDSDKKSEDEQINDTKKRLEEECGKHEAMFWVTQGREIENYISDSVLTETYKELLNNDSISLSLEKYKTIDDALGTIPGTPVHGDGWKRNYGENKVRIMGHLLKKLGKTDLEQHDLKAQLDALIDRIKSANPEILPTP